MATLSYPSATDVQLVLNAQEGAILGVVRGCTWWTKADVERGIPGSTLVTSVTLTTTRAMDPTLRRILQMGFGLVFPQDGGAGQRPVRESIDVARTKRSVAK
jgi:hypothetical protein